MGLKKKNNFFFKLLGNNIIRSFFKRFKYINEMCIYNFLFIYYFLFKVNNIFYFSNNSFYKYNFDIVKKFKYLKVFFNNILKKKIFYIRYFLTGLGYKIFIYRKKLYILIGLSHYIIMEILNINFLFAICKKKNLFILSTDYSILQDIKFKFFLLKKLNLYKIKGLFFFKIVFIKKYINFKKGKKQQFI